MLSVLAQVFYTVCIVCILWALYGYSLAFTGGSAYIGGLSKAFMSGITPDSLAGTFSADVAIPEMIYFCFQMTFAAITPALIVGAFAERMKFSAVALFIPLWVTLIYFPMAHMVWYWAGPDAITEAAKALAAAAPDAKAAAQAKLDDVLADGGQIFLWGALDFAGGTVVHINAGIAGLVACLVIGRRRGWPHTHMPPHNLGYTVIGASLLWLGWFGFNAGSAVAANGSAGMAMLVTQIAAAAAAIGWTAVEWAIHKRASVLGIASGAVAGLVAVTPAAGTCGPGGAMLIGLAAGGVCFFTATRLKHRLGYDDTLDVFGVHAVAGIVGALLTGPFAAATLGGYGHVASAWHQLWIQAKGVGFTIAWSALLSFAILKVLDRTIGLRVDAEQEQMGLDLAEHEERAYNLS
jgi:Amt family ammonium transporter